MAYKKDHEIFVMTTRVGYIPQINTYGPIPNPIKLKVHVCYDLIVAGVPLWEVDPVTKNNIQLTLENIYHDDKFDKKIKTEAPANKNVKKVEETELKGVVVDNPNSKKTVDENVDDDEQPENDKDGIEDGQVDDETPADIIDPEKVDTDGNIEDSPEGQVTIDGVKVDDNADDVKTDEVNDETAKEDVVKVDDVKKTNDKPAPQKQQSTQPKKKNSNTNKSNKN